MKDEIRHLSNSEIASYQKRYGLILDGQETSKEEMADLKAEMKAAGIDLKAFAIAMKEIRKPIDPGLKAKANEYLEQGGQFQLFALV